MVSPRKRVRTNHLLKRLLISSDVISVFKKLRVVGEFKGYIWQPQYSIKLCEFSLLRYLVSNIPKRDRENALPNR